ncbi:MAG: HIT domain-containing protein [Infirmifilum sp.]
MEPCVFCSIARGRTEAFIVYRDSDFISFLDKYPLTLGHTLIAPVEHYTNIFDMPEDKVCRAFTLARRIAAAQVRGLGARGVRVVMNNGREAGQEIMHAHIHLIPYGVPRTNRVEISREEGEEVARRIREALV